MILKTWIINTFATVALLASVPCFADQPGALPQDDVLNHLEQIIQWQRNASTLDPSTTSPRERIFQDTLQQSTLKAMRSGFKFAQAQAGLSATVPEEAPTEVNEEEQTPRQRMLKRVSENSHEIDVLKERLSAKNVTAAQRSKMEGSLKLATAKQELYQTVMANMTSSSNGTAKDLQNKINNLARETPELSSDISKRKDKAADDAASNTASNASTTAVTVTTARPTSSIFSVMGELFDNIRKQRNLNDFLSQTTQLEENSRDLLKGLREQLDAITGADNTGIPIDKQVSNFKQIGAQIIPLGESMLWITTSKAALADWQHILVERFESLLRSFGLQLLLLAFTLMIPLALSHVAKRAIDRYVPDPKRKRQANNARRIIVGIAIVFILLLNFISDFGSFATFAGFMTAGLAVALQSVLLSLVGHFFFYGRYGVRPGDRVKVAGVVGDIIQIGMMRFYLRELHTTEDGELKATGKIVTFPNSILFQPAAFYKYLSEAP